MEEMMKLYSMNGMDLGMGAFPTEATLTVNTASPLIAKLGTLSGETREKAAAYLWGLSLLSQRKLSAEELQKLLSDGYAILELL